jgi:hypothetical protein
MAKISGTDTVSFSVQIKRNAATTNSKVLGRIIFGMARAHVSITRGSYTLEIGGPAKGMGRGNYSCVKETGTKASGDKTLWTGKGPSRG